MHSVAKVHIPMPCRAEHNTVAVCFSSVSMAGFVFRSIIGFDFSNAETVYFSIQFTTKVLAKEFFCDDQGWAVEECGAK